jgi:predicted helicase
MAEHQEKFAKRRTSAFCGKGWQRWQFSNVAIIVLIKNPAKKDGCQLFYHDIGDYLTRKEKLNTIDSFRHIDNINWQSIIPNKAYDWINQRNDDFSTFISLGDKKDKSEKTFF